jgi:O-6-methylguanine DNA methyltransferase
MNAKRSPCAEIEPVLVAAATGEADPAQHARLQEHLQACAPCRTDFDRYRTIEDAVSAWRRAAPSVASATRAREELESLLADLRHRTLMYRIFPSPLGSLLIARSDQGVSLVEYLDNGGHDLAHSRLGQLGVEAFEDGADVEGLYRELMEYVEGRRTRLEWPLDLRLARSDFHRAVLKATARIPYGAVVSYAGLACEIGKPAAVRAVAQALRWNPLPIVVPCHRVVGTSGALTGYAGDKIGLKQRLLAVEGIHTVRRGHDLRIPRQEMYVLTPDGTEYCLPTCPWVAKVEHPHRLVFFGSRERAEAVGLGPCSDCRPDLHPLTP